MSKIVPWEDDWHKNCRIGLCSLAGSSESPQARSKWSTSGLLKLLSIGSVVHSLPCIVKGNRKNARQCEERCLLLVTIKYFVKDCVQGYSPWRTESIKYSSMNHWTWKYLNELVFLWLVIYSCHYGLHWFHKTRFLFAN